MHKVSIQNTRYLEQEIGKGKIRGKSKHQNLCNKVVWNIKERNIEKRNEGIIRGKVPNKA